MSLDKESKVRSYKNDIDSKGYKGYVFKMSPKSAHFKSMAFAFLIGGAICAVGQILIELFVSSGVRAEDASLYTSCILVIAAAFATGFGFYDTLGRFAGAGASIPITGFSNAIVAPAIEFKSEGMVYGLGANMFKIAGPVIVNGVAVSFVIALVYMIFGI